MTDETPPDEPVTDEPGTETAGSARPPYIHRARCTASEAAARIAVIADMLAQRHRRMEIRAFCKQEWGINHRSADYYIQKATTQLAEQVSSQVGEARTLLVAAIDRQYRKADDSGDVKNALAAIRELAKLHGLYNPGSGGGKLGAEDADQKARRLLGGVYEVEPGDTPAPIDEPDDYEDDGDGEFDDEEE